MKSADTGLWCSTLGWPSNSPGFKGDFGRDEFNVFYTKIYCL
jgi:hypothetical protein